eukprot:CAMPEP_0201542230 /NCGR_PEP_ID=MMETSP0161_2-20130828/71918_1 /ASSEMBLY_ACC=CAM_ASM_000251 /TAXON_ID=180227 /ORGANISM="Neoparamoeba aestuarina, Strain SoJaBio B1-5/56/2" /LENGTH=352 /DNA_ID=CAMNT_0047949857 /DNA_START=226 /DNA_END=1284 /DNA_ORIENTATION=-
MVDFAGWSLPVTYQKSLTDSHFHTRTNASVFDVSHMLQIVIEGKDRIPFIEKATVADLQGPSKKQKATYTLMTNKNGGVIDDCMVTAYHDHLYLVVNAACAEKDWEHLHSIKEGFDVQIRKLDNALIALQGPLASKVLSPLVSVNLKQMEFLASHRLIVGGESCIVTRCGYTGEDGFEISVPPDSAADLWNMFLDYDREKIWPAGLGVRDSLRLESGLCLYGNDLDDTTTPMEAALLWTISKRRRQEGGFLGEEVILDQIKTKKYQRKRVGIMLKVKGVPREGAEILSPDGEVIGNLTSGSFSPVLKQAIGMAYVHPSFSKIGTELLVRVKNKTFLAEVEKLPFLPTNYYSV